MLHARSDYQTIQPYLTEGPLVARQGGANFVVEDPESVETITGVLTHTIKPIIPDDEPVFLLRSRDVCAPNTVRTWVQFCIDNGVDPEDQMLVDVLAQADAMEAYASQYGSQLPNGEGYRDPNAEFAKHAQDE